MTFLPNSWRFAAAIEGADDGHSHSRALVDLAVRFGFASVFGGFLPSEGTPPSHAAVAPLVMVEQVPDGWGQRYNARNHLFRDAALLRLRKVSNPFTWAESYASCSNRVHARTIGGEAAEFGLANGYVVPANTLDPSGAAVSFGGARGALDPEEATALDSAASFAIGHFLQLRSPYRPSPAPITAREHDCLLWAVEGKTDWEISVILGISRSTVTKHIASARERLGAVNETHAVAMATQAARSFSRQRTTPCRSGSGPASMTSLAPDAALRPVGCVARRLVNQPGGAGRVEGHDPIAHRLQAHHPDPGSLRLAAALVDRSQRQKPAPLARVPARPGQSPKIVGSKILAEEYGSGHGKRSWFALSNHGCRAAETP